MDGLRINIFIVPITDALSIIPENLGQMCRGLQNGIQVDPVMLSIDPYFQVLDHSLKQLDLLLYLALDMHCILTLTNILQCREVLFNGSAQGLCVD